MKGTRHKSNPDFQRAAGWCEAAVKGIRHKS